MDARTQARAAHERGRAEMWGTAPMRAHELLVTEALAVADVDPARAALMLADASSAAVNAGDARQALATSARAMRLARGAGNRTEATVAVSRAVVSLVASRGRGAGTQVRAALARLPRRGSAETLGVLHESAVVLLWAEEYAGARHILEVASERARALRAPLLPIILDTLGAVLFRTGFWSAADAHSAEALRLAREVGSPFAIASSATTLARIAAARGDENACRTLLQDAFDLAPPGTLAFAYAASAAGLLELSLGRPEAAIRALEPLAATAWGELAPTVVHWAPDLIEAYVRAGLRREAVASLERFERRAKAGSAYSPRAAAARCRGLLASPGDFDASFGEALRLHARTPTPFERARSALCYGERLRRARRSAEATTQLRSAHEALGTLGAAPWAERARLELASPRRSGRAADDVAVLLTAHEVQVAALLQRGATNREIASALYVTPKTVEYHLANIYRKLGMRSRTELALRLARADPESSRRQVPVGRDLTH